MSPSTNQAGDSDTDWRNKWHRVFETDISPYPMINGIRDKDDAVQVWNEANRCEAPEKVKQRVKRAMQQFK